MSVKLSYDSFEQCRYVLNPADYSTSEADCSSDSGELVPLENVPTALFGSIFLPLFRNVRYTVVVNWFCYTAQPTVHFMVSSGLMLNTMRLASKALMDPKSILTKQKAKDSASTFQLKQV